MKQLGVRFGFVFSFQPDRHICQGADHSQRIAATASFDQPPTSDDPSIGTISMTQPVLRFEDLGDPHEVIFNVFPDAIDVIGMNS